MSGSLRVLETARALAQEEVVALLTECLEAAARGEMVSVALAAEAPDGTVRSCFSHTGGNIFMLAGALVNLQHHLFRHVERREVEEGEDEDDT